MEIQSYGKEKLACGPGIEESDEVIIVEGRADVLTLLKHGFKNAISINGTSIPETIIKLGKEKTLTAFVDGDRGGKLIDQELLSVTELDYVTKAPDGKEVEELTKKEIHKALRSKITAEQAKLEMFGPDNNDKHGLSNASSRSYQKKPSSAPQSNSNNNSNNNYVKVNDASSKEKEKFASMVEDLVGSRGANILDEKLNILGKVPVTELQSTIKSLGSGMYAVVFDGFTDKDLVNVAERAGISYLVCMESKVKESTKVKVYTAKDF
jgi:DNA primase